MDTIKKVANAILDAGEGCQSGLVYVDPVEAAKAAIAALSTEERSYRAGFNDGWEAANGEPPEAALSTDAEPVAWRVYDHDDGRWFLFETEEEAKQVWPDNNIRQPLFAAPPAPSVAVKALEWKEDGKYLRARMGDREYSINITADGETWAGATRPYAFGKNLTWSSVPNCSMVSLETAKAACQADCQYRYAALSAQVQDVAIQEGWQLVPKEPTASQLKDAAYSLMVKYGPEFVVSNLTASRIYAELVAAAPAAKLEEKP